MRPCVSGWARQRDITGGACSIHGSALQTVCMRWWKRERQQELKEVLTEEEYETLLHEPGRWKIGLRILEN